MKCPGSIVEVDCERVDDKVLFSKFFVALKPCIDGFLSGCRPYLGIDSTHLTGKYKGQLAAAVGIDGNNWLYPVAYGVFDLETTENWEWFLTQLKKSIGSPPGLALSSDAGKGLSSAIRSVFPESEHRECMRHLMQNFKKRFHGEVFSKNIWPAAYAYTKEKAQEHLDEIKNSAPQAIDFLDSNHKGIWRRSEFSELTKCDYVNNNVSECFNSWIKEYKSLNVVDLIDAIRARITVTFDKRRRIASASHSVILPKVMPELNVKSRHVGKVNIGRVGDGSAEVSGIDSEGHTWRHGIDLDRQECSCRVWQLTGKPCTHAIAFICSLRGFQMEDYVHDFFSVARFRAAYANIFRPMADKSQWISVECGFKVHPPLMKRPPRRPRKERIPNVLELQTKKRHQCKRCKAFAHQQRTCKAGQNEIGGTSKRKRHKSNKGKESAI